MSLILCCSFSFCQCCINTQVSSTMVVRCDDNQTATYGATMKIMMIFPTTNNQNNSVIVIVNDTVNIILTMLTSWKQIKLSSLLFCLCWIVKNKYLLELHCAENIVRQNLIILLYQFKFTQASLSKISSVLC